MSQYNHTPIVNGADNDAATWNNPMAELDAALGNPSDAAALSGSSAFRKIRSEYLRALAAETSLTAALNAAIAAVTADSEVVTARDGETVLDDRLNAMEAGIFNPARATYGAVLDGVTDDHDAFQAAIDAAIANGSGEVPLPTGTAYIASALDFTAANHITLRGHNTQILGDGAYALLQLGACDNITIEGIRFTNTVAYASVTNTSNLIRSMGLGATNITFRRCIFDGGYTGARPAYGDAHWSFEDCEFRNHLFCGSVAEIDHLHFDRCYFHDIGEDTADTTFYPDGHGHHTHPIYYNATTGHTVTGLRVRNCRFEDNVGSAVTVTTGSENAVIQDVVIDGNSFARNATYAEFGATTTRIRSDIGVSELNGDSETSSIRNVHITSNNFMQAPTTTGADWDLKAPVQLAGNVKDIELKGNIVNSAAGYFYGINVGTYTESTRRPGRVLVADNDFYLTVTSLASTANGQGIGRAGYACDDWHVHDNLFVGACMGVYGVFTNSKFHDNTFRDIGANNSDTLASVYLTNGSINNQVHHNTIITTTPASMAKDGMRLDSGADGNIVESNLFVGLPSSLPIRNSGADNVIRHLQTSTLEAGDFALSAGFGSTAAVSSISGNSLAGSFSVTANGTGLGANPTITITYKDGPLASGQKAFVQRTGGSQLTVVTTIAPGVSTAVITFNGTPVAGQVYSFVYRIFG